MKSAKDKLKEYARLIARQGADSPAAMAYLQSNLDDRDFAQLARLTTFLHALLDTTREEEGQLEPREAPCC